MSDVSWDEHVIDVVLCSRGWFTRASLLAVLCCGYAVCSFAANTVSRFAGTHLDVLTVGKKTYENITIKEVTARSITFLYAGGFASAQLKNLSPELQARFGYSPEAERESDAQMEKARKVAAAKATGIKHNRKRLLIARAEVVAIARLKDVVG